MRVLCYRKKVSIVLKILVSRILASVLLPLMVMLVPGEATRAEQTVAQPTADYEAMLNLNYIYGVSFEDEDIAIGTMLSLLEMAEEKDVHLSLSVEQADFFSKAYYGRTVDYAACGLEVLDGRVLIPAMGYDLYTHELISVEENGDTVKVVSKVVCEGHDEVFDALCTSEFVKNADSAFGYNLISAEILA